AGDDRIGRVPASPSSAEAAQEYPEQSAGGPGRPAAMNGTHTDLDAVGRGAEAFLARYRRGERPSLIEYTDKYPELRVQIREPFPAMGVMEEPGSGEGPESGLPRQPCRARCPSDWAIIACCARWGAAAWVSFTKRCSNRWAATSLSRCCLSTVCCHRPT